MRKTNCLEFKLQEDVEKFRWWLSCKWFKYRREFWGRLYALKNHRCELGLEEDVELFRWRLYCKRFECRGDSWERSRGGDKFCFEIRGRRGTFQMMALLQTIQVLRTVFGTVLRIGKRLVAIEIRGRRGTIQKMIFLQLVRIQSRVLGMVSLMGKFRTIRNEWKTWNNSYDSFIANGLSTEESPGNDLAQAKRTCGNWN